MMAKREEGSTLSEEKLPVSALEPSASLDFQMDVMIESALSRSLNFANIYLLIASQQSQIDHQ